MKKQNMAVELADLTNFAKLVDATDSEEAIEFLLYSLAFLLIKLFFLKEKFGCKMHSRLR
jgi:hypothetical protein